MSGAQQMACAVEQGLPAAAQMGAIDVCVEVADGRRHRGDVDGDEGRLALSRLVSYLHAASPLASDGDRGFLDGLGIEPSAALLPKALPQCPAHRPNVIAA